MKRDTLLLLGMFFAAFAGATAFFVFQRMGNPQPQDQPSLGTVTAIEPTIPIQYGKPAVATPPKVPSPPQPSAPVPKATGQPTKKMPDESEIAKAIIEENASWLFQHDKDSKPIRDAQGKRVPSALGQTYAHHVLQAEKNGIRGPANQHAWAMAKLSEEVKRPPTFNETAKSMGNSPGSRQLGAMMTPEQRAPAVIIYANALRAWQTRTKSPLQPFTWRETAIYLGFFPDSNQIGVMTTEQKLFTGAVHVEVLKVWQERSVPPKNPSASSSDDGSLFEETRIPGTISGIIQQGMIFKTSSGNFYEVVGSIYAYTCWSNPKVIVLQKGEVFRLLIDGLSDSLVCRRLDRASVIESVVTGNLDGLFDGKMFHLHNGQVWQQTDIHIRVAVGVRPLTSPSVIIYPSGTLWKMKVEGLDRSFEVNRIWADESKDIVGIWQATVVRRNSNVAPPADARKHRITIERDLLTIEYDGKIIAKAKYTLQLPDVLTLYVTEGQDTGATIKGGFKLEGDKLTLTLANRLGFVLERVVRSE